MNENTFSTSSGIRPIRRYFSEAEKISTSDDIFSSFISSISNDDFASVIFEDSLDCFGVTNSITGSYECKAFFETAPCGLEMIHVIASSYANIEGMQCHTQLDALLTKRLQTMSQTQKETTVFNERSLTKVTCLNKVADGYDVNREIVEDGEKSHDTYFYTNKCLEGFISEGANLILQRLMIKKGFLTPFEAVGLDSQCVPCLLTYVGQRFKTYESFKVDLCDRNIVIKGEEITVTGIERRLQSSATLPASWQTYYMSDG
ncbi:hypothetical protein P879_11907 [Paragonimus westermani]|uniref:Ciliogenesis-associated TTC17-interacting protein N-terminal domain-containing protein n=1 Tax=Paragonimus westermani TaxID=34504 RepID=A0A8T0D8G6_9TREM|nr:hypothetical protein P879_11907 [Paragonimus westermani]